ncbi:MAG: hypothetical protein ACREPN_08215 [Rudaea sp.]
MNPQDFLPTAILLGVFVVCAGCYGLLYTLGRLRTGHVFTVLAYAAYLLQGIVTAVLVTHTSLATGWKLFLVASFLIYAGIPPITWRHLERTHQTLGHES